MKKHKIMVKLDDIRKSFDGEAALEKIDLEIRKNEIVSIIGPSGSGKTTLLRIIAGLEQCDSGRISVEGKAGMVFQHSHLWPHKTVLENIIEPLVSVKKLDVSAAKSRAMEILKRLNLDQRASAYPDTLSGGEIQRTAIARSLVMEPEILLLDEVTSALDPELINEVLAVLRKLAKEKRTLIIVTHELGLAREISDRIVFMDSGKIVEEGHPFSIFKSPQKERTRRFIQSIKRGD